ncbi:MAG: type II secretion system F family protein [Prevotellaceae bacterium]|jgi:type IV pilus assembly protein PilC|nr:type II secretion system F family protein [Prevotellaceae bacterium]
MQGIEIKQIKKKQPKEEKSSRADSLMTLLNTDISFGAKKLNDKKKSNFYNDLHILLSSGIDLRSTLELMCEEVTKKDEKEIYESIKNKVLSGSGLSEALEQSGKFSAYEFYSIRIGEETGCLIDVLKDIGNYFTKKIEQKRKMTSAFAYPVFVLSAAVLAVIFMLTFVVPMFEDIFARFGNDLPYLTKVVINISNFISNNIPLIIMILLLTVVAIYYIRKNERFRQMQSSWLLHIPFFGELSRKMYLARFCLAMALLTGAHTPLLQALGLVKKMITFYPLQKSIDTMEHDIMHGKTLHESMSKFSIYDRRMLSLVKVGEEVNQLDAVFNRLKTQYTDDVDYRTGMMGSVLEPLMIILIGLFVGVILIAMYLPIFKLSTSIGF